MIHKPRFPRFINQEALRRYIKGHHLLTNKVHMVKKTELEEILEKENG